MEDRFRARAEEDDLDMRIESMLKFQRKSSFQRFVASIISVLTEIDLACQLVVDDQELRHANWFDHQKAMPQQEICCQ